MLSKKLRTVHTFYVVVLVGFLLPNILACVLSVSWCCYRRLYVTVRSAVHITKCLIAKMLLVETFFQHTAIEQIISIFNLQS